MHFAMSQKMTAAQRPLLKLLRDEISPQAGTMVAPNTTLFFVTSSKYSRSSDSPSNGDRVIATDLTETRCGLHRMSICKGSIKRRILALRIRNMNTFHCVPIRAASR